MKPSSSVPPILRFGVFELDPRAGELRKKGMKIRLQGQPVEILVMLLEHPGEIISREELQKKLWPGDTFVDFEQGLNNAIKRLRAAFRLGLTPRNTREPFSIIRTTLSRVNREQAARSSITSGCNNSSPTAFLRSLGSRLPSNRTNLAPSNRTPILSFFSYLVLGICLLIAPARR